MGNNPSSDRTSSKPLKLKELGTVMVEKSLGKGAFGTVVKIRDKKGRTYALKMCKWTKEEEEPDDQERR